MVRYWKLVGMVLAVAVLATVMVAAVPTVKPDQGGSEPQLFTLLENVEIGIDSTEESAFVNVENFSKFKGFLTWAGPSGENGHLAVTLIESFDGSNRTVFGSASETLLVNTEIGDLGDYTVYFPNSTIGTGPFRHLGVEIVNTNNTEPQTVSVFLYAER